MTNRSENAPITPAERMRLYRARRRNGLHNMEVLLHDTEIDSLVTQGFLDRDRRHDQNAIQNALGEFICHSLGPSDRT